MFISFVYLFKEPAVHFINLLYWFLFSVSFFILFFTIFSLLLTLSFVLPYLIPLGVKSNCLLGVFLVFAVSIHLRTAFAASHTLWKLHFHFHLSQDIFSCLFLFLLWPIGCFSFCCFVPWLSHVWVFATPWPAARQAPPSSTTSQSLLQFMSIESVILFNLHRLVNFPAFSL